MDKHKIAVPSELLKAIIGFVIIGQLGGWFGLEDITSFATVGMVVYIVTSLLLTLYFSSSEKQQLQLDL